MNDLAFPFQSPELNSFHQTADDDPTSDMCVMQTEGVSTEKKVRLDKDLTILCSWLPETSRASNNSQHQYSFLLSPLLIMRDKL